MANKKSDKVVFKLFDPKNGEEKRLHNCSLCKIYKREIAKGDKDALSFYKEHISEFARKHNGITVEFFVGRKQKAIEAGRKA